MSERLLPLRSLPQLAPPGATPCPPRRWRRPRLSWTPCGRAARRRCSSMPSGFGDVQPGEALFHHRPASSGRSRSSREATARGSSGVADRYPQVPRKAQYRALCSVAIPVPGGVASIELRPSKRAGWLRTGGPLSPALVGADDGGHRPRGGRTGCLVASPKPQLLTLAAAGGGGRRRLVAAGGAHAIAALAYGRGTHHPPPT